MVLRLFGLLCEVLWRDREGGVEARGELPGGAGPSPRPALSHDRWVVPVGSRPGIRAAAEAEGDPATAGWGVLHQRRMARGRVGLPVAGGHKTSLSRGRPDR